MIIWVLEDKISLVYINLYEKIAGPGNDFFLFNSLSINLLSPRFRPIILLEILSLQNHRVLQAPRPQRERHCRLGIPTAVQLMERRW